MQNRMFLIVVGAGLLTLAGCGPSPRDVVEKYRAQYQQKREQLKKVLALLPPEGTVKEKKVEGALNPPFRLLIRNPASTAEGVMASQLADPEAKPVMNLFLGDHLITALFWTGPKRADDSFSSGDAEFMEKSLSAGLTTPYLVVHRTVGLVMPTPVPPNKFTPGRVTFEGFVVDLDKMEIIASYTVKATTASRVRVQFREGESKEARVRAFVKSTMWTDARKKIAEKLKECTGGEVDLK